jgi:UDPglucose 6-dehydrogenase
MNILLDKGINVIIYDKNYPDSENNINIFKKKADLIITNRYNHNLDDVRDKVYTRDIYMRD